MVIFMGKRQNVIKKGCTARLYSTPVISALRKLRQEDRKFEAILGYKVRPCLKNSEHACLGLKVPVRICCLIRKFVLQLSVS
jgi:hypothetical protein